MTEWKVGMKAECVDVSDTVPGAEWWGDIPVLDAVYTVDAIVHFDQPCLVLREIKNAPCLDFAYNARRFRPIVERESFASLYNIDLNPSPEKALEEIMLDTLADIYLAADEAFEKTKSRIEPEVHIGFDPPSNH